MNAAPTTILLVDDDASIRETTADLLTFAGFHVVTATGGLDAIERLNRQRVDLILSDIVMPRGDGYELLACVRSEPNLNSIPIVMLSAKADKSDIRRGMVGGADDYLTKPFQPDELIAVIRNQLEKRNHRRDEMLRLKRQLASIIPHELRTPLTGVLGYAELLNEIAAESPGSLQQSIASACANLRQSGVRIQRLVERVELWLELETEPGRVLAGARAEPSIGWAARAKMLFAVVAETAGRSADLQVDLPEAPLAVPTHYLMEALGGFAENSIHASRPSTPIVITGRADGAVYRIVMRYAGPPWPAGQIQKMDTHAPFDRDLADQQGLGLGLAIGCKLCELLGTQPVIANMNGVTEASFAFPLHPGDVAVER